MFEERDVHVTHENNPLEPAIHFEEVEKWYPARRILDALAPWDVEQMETAIGYLSDLFMASAKGLSANDISTSKLSVLISACSKTDDSLDKWVRSAASGLDALRSYLLLMFC